MLLGAEKRAAAEFSFFLAIPTMVGAFVYDLYKSRGEMTMDHAGLTLEGLGIVPDSLEAIAPQYLWRFRRTGQFAHRGA